MNHVCFLEGTHNMGLNLESSMGEHHYGWMDGWLDGWMDGWDGWMDENSNRTQQEQQVNNEH